MGFHVRMNLRFEAMHHLAMRDLVLMAGVFFAIIISLYSVIRMIPREHRHRRRRMTVIRGERL